MKKRIFEILSSFKAGSLKSNQLSHQRAQSEVLEEELSVSTSKDESEPAFIPLSDNPMLVPKAKYVCTHPETRYFQINDVDHPRKIAYTISGDIEGENILICLPGLLETKESFAVIHAYFLKFEGCKVISIDLSGRGESDYIGDFGGYKMSLYLSDISKLIQSQIEEKAVRHQRITILGTSMGGVLAMYLTQIFGKSIFGIMLNDIALTVNWTSLYLLYKSMKNELGFREIRELARDLRVDGKAISDVQLPGHFDLSYKADIWGMNFHEALEGFKGKVGLIYGSESKICTKKRVEGAKEFIPHLQSLEVANAGHPAPFNLLVCDFIQSQMEI